MTLTVPDALKREILDKLDRLPRPQQLAGKVTVLFEFNLNDQGLVTAVNSEIWMREPLTRR